MYYRYITLITIAVMLFATITLHFQPTHSQSDGELTPTPRPVYVTDLEKCESIIDKALSDLGVNCADMARNSVCYGHELTEATFFEEPSIKDFFTKPGDLADLTMLETVKTTILDPTDAQWGIAVMYVQPNIPDLTPDQLAVFLLAGNASLENLVEPQTALTSLATPIVVYTQGQAELFAKPDATTSPIASIGKDTELYTDGVSPDGVWFRVLYDRRAAWVNKDKIAPNVNIGNLTTIDPERHTPMQVFFFDTTVDPPFCGNAPAGLAIQTPDDKTLTININGLDLRIGSTIYVEKSGADKLLIYVTEGSVIFFPDDPDKEFTLGPGEVVQMPINADGSIDITAPWVWYVLSQVDMDAKFNFLIQIPDNVLVFGDLPSIVGGSGIGGVQPKVNGQDVQEPENLP